MAIPALTGAAPLTALNTTGAASATPAAGGADGAGGFGDALKSLLTAIDGTTGAANTAVSNMMNGTGDVHEAMIALQRAEMTMQLSVQVRNKLVAAYQDIMRMPI